MTIARKTGLKKAPKRSVRSAKPPNLTVITVRISDEEKERFDTIMNSLNIKRYSDVMRMALRLVKREQFSGYFG